jgi:hypothetical protein
MVGRFAGFLHGDGLEVTGRASSLASRIVAPQLLVLLVCMLSVQRLGHCGSWLAGDDGLTDDLLLVERVHIHSCGNGYPGFRPVGASLLAMEVNDDAGSLTPRSALRGVAAD